LSGIFAEALMRIGGRLEAVLQRHQRCGVLRDRRFADQAGEQVALRRDLQRIAQSRDLVRHQILDQLARALHRLFALHHDVEVEVVDQADQQVGELFMRAEHLGEALHLALAAARLEIGQLRKLPYPLLQRLELGAGRKLRELLLGAAGGGRETVFEHRQDAGR